MRGKTVVAALSLIALTGSAGAQSMCGDPPIAPAMPSPAEMQQKTPAEASEARHGAFLDIKKWQISLKSYRDCLNATVDTDRRDLGEAQRSPKPDTKKIGQLQQEITDTGHAWDTSVDQEEQVVNQFHAAQVAYCARNDVDRGACPKS